jgi:hypothetical protein
VRKECEIVSLGYQGIAVDTVMAIIKQIGQNFPVAPELGVHIANIIVLITVNTVIVVVAALIGTEFLIRPSKEPGSAVKTYSFHSECFHKDK